jgi:hypothetical protein
MDGRKALLVALGVSMLAGAIVVEQGFRGAGYYAAVIAAGFFNALFLANPFGFFKSMGSALYLVGMLFANFLLLLGFDASVFFLLILWLPAIAGVLVGLWARSQRRK